MVQGGTTDAGNSEYLAQGLVELIQDESIREAIDRFLEGQEESLKNLDLTKVEDVVNLLNGDNGKVFLGTVSEKLSEEEKFKKLVEQIGKDRVMMEKLETLGNRLLINRIVGGAAFATLTGALAGTLAIGGVVGALIVGGAVLAGFLAIAAIAAIGYTIYKHRGEIKEGVIEAGKAIKGFVKNVIDKLPTIQARKDNFVRLHGELSQFIVDNYGSEENDKIKDAQGKAKVIEMLQDENQRLAIEKLIDDKTIQNFSKDEMKKLIDKGLSTHEADKDALNELMDKFLPEIMAIGSNIKEVEQKVGEKVQEMKPESKVDDPNSEKAAGTAEHLSP